MAGLHPNLRRWRPQIGKSLPQSGERVPQIQERGNIFGESLKELGERAGIIPRRLFLIREREPGFAVGGAFLRERAGK